MIDSPILHLQPHETTGPEERLLSSLESQSRSSGEITLSYSSVSWDIYSFLVESLEGLC